MSRGCPFSWRSPSSLEGRPEQTLPAVSAGASLIRRDSDGFVQLAGSAALALGVTYGLKYAVNAERPNGGDHSFPSGHALLSFCSAEFLRRRYGWAWGVPAYAVAGFVGYSRVRGKLRAGGRLRLVRRRGVRARGE